MKLTVIEIMELGAGQTFRANRNVLVKAIRPHLYKHQNPPGILVVEIHDNNRELVARSNPVAISDLPPSDFYHGYIRFDLNAHLRAGEEYTIVVKGESGYFFSEAAYIGVCNSFDLRAYEATYAPNSGVNSPLDFEIWELK